jgi:thiamine biosynthesis lipoprotein
MRKFLLTFLISAFFIASCVKKSAAPEYEVQVLNLMGTEVQITVPKENAALIAQTGALIKTVADTIIADCAKIAKAEGETEVSEITYRLIEKSFYYRELSGGRFNPSIYSFSKLYGFPEGPFVTPEPAALSAALKLLNSHEVGLRTGDGRFYADGGGLSVDLGGFAKGWIVDAAAEFLRGRGVKNFIVNAGGDLYAAGTKGGMIWRFGITDPNKTLEYLSAVNLEDKALATSGNYEREYTTDKGDRISHIFNALTGENVRIHKSVSVIAESAESADALATIYFMLTEAEIKELCENLSTPVFIVSKDDKQIRLCGWERFE